MTQGYGDINEDGTWKNNLMVYEWVVWFQDDNIISQYDSFGRSRNWNDIREYSELVSPLYAIGWLPFSENKAARINTINDDDIVVSVNISAHIMECDTYEFDDIYVTIRNSFSMPISSSAPPPKRDTYYILGIVDDHDVYPKRGTFMSIDSAGNTRLGTDENVTVPVIPVRPYKKFRRIKEQIGTDEEL